MYSLADDVIVADLGGTKIAVRSHRGERHAFLPTDDGRAVMSWLMDWLRASLSPTTRRVVLSSAPELDSAGIIRSWPSRPDWVGLPLVRAIEAISTPGKLRVSVVSDGAAGALGEARAYGIDDMIYFGLGTGVSTGWVSEGAPIPTRIPINLAHVVVGHPVAQCVCGQYGCLQAWASARGIRERLAHALDRPSISWSEIREEWYSQPFEPVRSEIQTALARAAALALSIFGVRTVVFGGRAAESLPGLADDVSITLGQTDVRILPGRLGAEAAIVGATIFADLDAH